MNTIRTAENSWVAKVITDENGDLFLELPDALLKHAGWFVGDTLDFQIADDGNVVIKKVKGSSKGIAKHLKANNNYSDDESLQDHIEKKLELRRIKRSRKNWREKLPKQFIKSTLRAVHESKAGMTTPYVFGRVGKKQILKKRSSRILNMLNGENTVRSARSFEATETEKKGNWITIDLTSYAHEKLHFAADLLGISLVDFAVQAGLEQAEKIIAQHEKNITRQPGSMHGDISIAADFDAPLIISAPTQNRQVTDDDSDWVRNPIKQELLDVLNGRGPSPLEVLKDTVIRYDDPLDPVICSDIFDDEKPDHELLIKLDSLPDPIKTILINQVRSMVMQSGVYDGFDEKIWLARWLFEPLPALGGKCPSDFLGDIERQKVVIDILSAMQSGAFV